MVTSRNAMMTPPRSSPRRSSPYRPTRRMAAGLASAVIEQIASNTPNGRAAIAAVRAGRAISSAYRATRRPYPSSRTQRSAGNPIMVSTRSQRYVTNGKYKGKFKRERKAYGNQFAEKGFLNTIEVSGTVTDPDCVYLLHVAADPYLIIGHAVEALVRKLFAKGGAVVNSVTEEVGISSPIDSAAWVIKLVSCQRGNPTPIVWETKTFTTTNNQSIRDIATPMLTHFMQYSTGYTTVPGTGNNANTFEPMFLQLYSVDYAVSGNTDRIIANIDLRNESIVYYSKSTMKIQNRSKAADGGVDATNVNNNPLVGRSYTFSGTPNPRQMGAYPLGRIPITRGVGLVRASDLVVTTGGPAYKEPPKSSAFTNCKSTSKVRLDPGDVKTSTVSVTGEKNFMKWLKAIRLSYGPQGIGADGNYYSTYSIFKSQMFAFEDLINVNLTELISCAYEVNRESGIFFKTTGKNAAVTGFDQLTYSLP